MLTRSQAPVQKKSKKKKGSKSSFANPVVLGVGGGAIALVVAVGAFLMLRGGGSSGQAASGSSAPSAPGDTITPVSSTRRSSHPEPSKDPKDWQSSYPGFAACLGSRIVNDPSGPYLEVSGGPVGITDDGPVVRWEGTLLGQDRRSIASISGADGGKLAVGFRMSETVNLPEPFVILFSVDKDRLSSLMGMTYRRVKFEAKLEPEAYLVWLNKDGRINHVAKAPPLVPNQPTKPDPPQEDDVKPLYVVWFTITRFERAP
jgi:hypothetical protein